VESNLGVQRNVEGAGGRVEQRARARAGVGAERRAPPGLRRRATALLLPLLLGACTTTRETTTTWEGYGPPERLGEVAWVRETVKDEQGNPVGGAVLGAAVGGLFGEAVGGHAPGALVGAAGGAAAGAALSKGSGEERLYDVGVRFEDGSTQVFRFANASPFRGRGTCCGERQQTPTPRSGHGGASARAAAGVRPATAATTVGRDPAPAVNSMLLTGGPRTTEEGPT